MDGTDAGTRIAALTAIVQTLVLEHYWEEDEEQAKKKFLAMAEADHPVAMAIVEALSEAELDAAFRWPHGTSEDAGNALPATPVIAFLTEEQYERARVTAIAEDEGDQALAFAMQEPGLPGAGSLPASERIRIAERQFVSSMVEDLVRRRGQDPAVRAGTVDETIAAMPEPWRSRSRRELERLREDLGEMLAERGESRALAGPHATGRAPGDDR